MDQISTLSEIVLHLTSTLKNEKLFDFGSANTSLIYSSIISFCNNEITPLRFDMVPNSLISLDLNEMNKRDLNFSYNFNKNELLLEEKFNKKNKTYQKREYNQDFCNESRDIILNSKKRFYDTMLSYIIVNLPEPERKLIPNKEFIRFFKMADNRIEIAKKELKKQKEIEENEPEKPKPSIDDFEF